MNDRIIEIVKETLEKEQDVLALYLFGSRARGDFKKISDYDFYVFLNHTTKNSLREDQLYSHISRITEEFNVDIHLTFQYLFIVDEDRSLLLKITGEGKLLFSKALLFGSFEQIGLKRYYLCLWDVNADTIQPLVNTKANRNKFKRMQIQLINRILKGYKQPYFYKKEKRISKKVGLIDGVGVIGDSIGNSRMLLVLESYLPLLHRLITEHFGTITVLYPVYIPSTSLPDLEKYILYVGLQEYLRKEKKNSELLLLGYEIPNLEKISLNYLEGKQRMNTLISIEKLPEEIRLPLLAGLAYRIKVHPPSPPMI